jgi:hypothetical protein
VTYHGFSFFACFSGEFDSMLETRRKDFPISPEALSHRPQAAVIFLKAPGTSFI